ncbi:hypothetical protein EKO04_010310 [Ascochyta lentis]|uniref:Uncharacterized protein n=1 Tax=Ascochyta lentis TaxID=205686 RepID=A0A8H7IYE3_9PLEO|nr:hypothetical protein EKO04_010310 [Ascochyta lentis]
MEEKCTLLYRDLFPQDDSASPYEEAVIPGSPTTANVSEALLRVKLETIMAQHGIDPELAARVSTIFQGASEAMKCNTNKLKDNYGLLTPPTSAESSPETSQLDAFTTPTFEPLPGVPVTRGVLDNNFIDPLLYPTHDMDSMPLFDSGIGTECAWESYNAAPAMVRPVNISDAAFAGTSKILPSLDVCSDCLSTNIIYGFPVAPVDEPQPLSGNLDVVQDVEKFPSPTEESSSVDPFMGADPFTDEAGSILTLSPELNWDEWLLSEDRCDDIWTQSGVSAEYSAIDKLFEF